MSALEEAASAAAPLSPEALATANALGANFAWVIVELAPDGILVSDDEGRILMANRQITQLFGYHRETLIGARVESLLPARLRGAHEVHRAEYVAAPAIRTMGVGLDLFGRRADGSEFPIEVSLSPAVTDQGIATVVIIRDVTEQRALERVARAAADLDHDEGIAADMHDRVIGHLFGCGLSLASVLGRNCLDDRIAQQLHDVVDELDDAVRHIRSIVFARLEHQLDPTRSDR